MGKASVAARLRVFFDIDGTILLTDGAGRTALRVALEAVYGTTGPLDGYTFHGKTDPQIVLELMHEAGIEELEVRRLMPEVWPHYLGRLEQELGVRRTAGRIRLLPGVSELLAALVSRREIALGLLTGNIEEGARLKLIAVGLESMFQIGGFGSDSESRAEIARIAVQRARAVYGPGVGPVVVIGDTPADVACARAVDAFAVAVATGRHDVEELTEAGADVVFKDFSDTASVLECILSVARPSGDTVGGNGRR